MLYGNISKHATKTTILAFYSLIRLKGYNSKDKTGKHKKQKQNEKSPNRTGPV